MNLVTNGCMLTIYLVVQVGLAHLKLGVAHAAGPAHLDLPYTLHREPERAITV